MATEVGVGYIRLIPSMEGFSRTVTRTLERELGGLGEDLGRALGNDLGVSMSRALDGEGADIGRDLVQEIESSFAGLDLDGTDAGREMAAEVERALEGVHADIDLDGRQVGSQAASEIEAALRGLSVDVDGRGPGHATGREMAQAISGELDDVGADISANLEGSGEEGGTSFIGGFAKTGPLVAVAAAAAIGKVLMDGIAEAMEQNSIEKHFAAQMGLTTERASHYGNIAGGLYSSGLADSFEQGMGAIQSAFSEGLLSKDSAEDLVGNVSLAMLTIGRTWDLESAEIAKATRSLFTNQMAGSAEEGLDIIAKGLQGLNNEQAAELLETFSEYGAQFKRMGLSGPQAIGLMRQALGAGAKDVDRVGDALHEIPRIILEEFPKAEPVLTSIGLNAQQIGADMAAGGDRANKATGQILDALKAIPDPAERAAARIALMGDVSGELGDSLDALDLKTAGTQFENFGGAAVDAANALTSGFGAKLTEFKRTFSQVFVDLFQGDFAQVKTGVLRLGEIIKEGISEYGPKAADALMEWAPKLLEKLPQLGERLADAMTRNPEKTFKIVAVSAAIMTALIELPGMLAVGLGLIAGGLVGKLISKLIDWSKEKFPEWWQAVKDWFAEKASSVGDWFSDLGTGISDWFGSLWDDWIATPISNLWTSVTTWFSELPGKMADGAESGMGSFTTWLSALPGKIAYWVGAGLAELISLGANLVLSIWSGLKSAWESVSTWFSELPGKIVEFVTVDLPALGQAGVDWLVALWDGAKNKAEEFWAWLQELPGRVYGFVTVDLPKLAQAGVDWLASLWGGAQTKAEEFWVWLQELPGRAKDYLSRKYDQLTSAGSDFLRSIWDGISGGLSWLYRNIVALPGQIKDWIVGGAWQLYNAGLDLVTGLWNGIKGAWGWLKDQANGLLDSFVDGFKRHLHIGSPSKLFADEIGKWIPPGIAVGIKGNMGPLDAAVADMSLALRPEMPDAAGMASQRPVIEFNSTGGADAILDWLQNSIRVRGGGNVQRFLGQGQVATGGAR
ncbi:hypothetical protein ACGFXC_10395 [Streptomyces sp. NPDC048507]|uniref:phage tail protein n=1 Tax=Streptomyces sp. NPDC048507 TaxID=3365560 RepID=UPI00371F3048